MDSFFQRFSFSDSRLKSPCLLWNKLKKLIKKFVELFKWLMLYLLSFFSFFIIIAMCRKRSNKVSIRVILKSFFSFWWTDENCWESTSGKFYSERIFFSFPRFLRVHESLFIMQITTAAILKENLGVSFIFMQKCKQPD